MTWRKLGQVYVATGEQDWAATHAFLPTSVLLNDDVIRVYAAFLDAEKVGRIGFVDVDAADPTRILRVSQEPVLDVGIPGTFDDNGVTPVSTISLSDKVLLYYVGWQLGVRVRYFLFSGLASRRHGETTFERVSQTPLLDRSDGELFARTVPHVLFDEGRWKMWYIGGGAWIRGSKGVDVPTYSMRYAESNSPTKWPRTGRICLEPNGPDEFGFGRPFVVKDGDLFRNWYSIRSLSEGYRIGYGESADGLSWIRRDDEAGLDVSASGWDSEMVAFACVQPTQHGTYMFYNGNNYGETGFGAAVLEKEGS
jgi:hypothetical protein